jgi:hypothetical protein
MDMKRMKVKNTLPKEPRKLGMKELEYLELRNKLFSQAIPFFLSSSLVVRIHFFQGE